MISISPDVSVKILALIDEIRDAVPYELLPSLSTLEFQASSLEIDEGLVSELITLLSIFCSSSERKSGRSLSKEDTFVAENHFNDLILILNDIRAQESIINCNRIRR